MITWRKPNGDEIEISSMTDDYLLKSLRMIKEKHRDTIESIDRAENAAFLIHGDAYYVDRDIEVMETLSRYYIDCETALGNEVKVRNLVELPMRQKVEDLKFSHYYI